MLNKNERMNKLANAGVDTGKFFNINLPEGLAPGATISLVINDNGQPVVVNEKKKDAVAEQIITDGYVKNTKLHRRFVMAQMFQMLNYVSYDKREKGYSAYLNNMYAYDYTLKMMLEEVRVLSKLQDRDVESFTERAHFFTKEVIVSVLNDYMVKLKKHIERLPEKKCKGVPYKKVKGQNIFVEDLEKKVYRPLSNIIMMMKYASKYADIYIYLKKFMNEMVKLPYNTPKSKVWIDAFKGEGAYYTLKNLIMYHGCVVVVDDGYHEYRMYNVDAMRELDNRLYAYRGEGWRMFAFMKKVIKDNNFDFHKKMAEIYNK